MLRRHSVPLRMRDVLKARQAEPTVQVAGSICHNTIPQPSYSCRGGMETVMFLISAVVHGGPEARGSRRDPAGVILDKSLASVKQAS